MAASIFEVLWKNAMDRKMTIYYPQSDDERAMYHFVHLFEQETKFPSEPSCEFLGIFFNLGGSEIKIQVGTSRHTLTRNQFAIVYLPEACCELTYTVGKHNHFITQFETSYLKKIAEVFPILDGLLDKVENRIPTIVSTIHFSITPKTRVEINQVIHNDYTGRFRDLYLGCKFEDIIIDALANLKKEGLPGFDDTEIAKIKQAYTRISSNAKARHTVSMIADELAIDKRKLEKGFRLLFNTTVHSFILDERLKIAVRLLRDTTRGISEIAKSVGYSNRKTFTKLFKRKFGYPPIALRDNKED
jgi:AraC-like DNA-binding protein